MKIKLSDRDRAFVAQAQREIAWQGAEPIVVARYELGEALKLAEVTKRTNGTPFDKLSRAATFDAKLSREQMELLIGLVAGGGFNITGDIGPLAGELIQRLRKVCPPAEPKKAGGDE